LEGIVKKSYLRRNLGKEKKKKEKKGVKYGALDLNQRSMYPVFEVIFCVLLFNIVRRRADTVQDSSKGGDLG
jgi:hypothetical protein